MTTKLEKRCARNGELNGSVLYCITRSCWLAHGSIAAVGSIFSQTILQRPLAHWWMLISTDKGYFCAQFNKPNSLLSLTHHDTSSEVDAAGIKSAGRAGDDPDVTSRDYFDEFHSSGTGWVPNVLFMSQIYDWMSAYDDDYNLFTNNCQHFCEAFTRRFSEVHHTDPMQQVSYYFSMEEARKREYEEYNQEHPRGIVYNRSCVDLDGGDPPKLVICNIL